MVLGVWSGFPVSTRLLVAYFNPCVLFCLYFHPIINVGLLKSFCLFIPTLCFCSVHRFCKKVDVAWRKCRKKYKNNPCGVSLTFLQYESWESHNFHSIRMYASEEVCLGGMMEFPYIRGSFVWVFQTLLYMNQWMISVTVNLRESAYVTSSALECQREIQK